MVSLCLGFRHLDLLMFVFPCLLQSYHSGSFLFCYFFGIMYWFITSII